MIYKIKILKGINDIEFGMTADDVRKNLSGNFISEDVFLGINELEGEIFKDDYHDQGFYCYYDKNWILEAMGFYRPAKLFLDDVDVLSINSEKCLSFLRKIDPNLINYHDEYISMDYSLSFKETDVDDRGVTEVSNFLVGRPGYFEYAK